MDPSLRGCMGRRLFKKFVGACPLPRTSKTNGWIIFQQSATTVFVWRTSETIGARNECHLFKKSPQRPASTIFGSKSYNAVRCDQWPWHSGFSRSLLWFKLRCSTITTLKFTGCNGIFGQSVNVHLYSINALVLDLALDWYLHQWTLLLTWNNLTISMENNYIHHKVRGEITYPFQTSTVEVWEWMINSLPQVTGQVITYPGWN